MVEVRTQTATDLSQVGMDLVLKVKTKYHVKIVFLRVSAELYRVIEKFGWNKTLYKEVKMEQNREIGVFCC